MYILYIYICVYVSFIASKINVTLIVVYLPISKQQSILAVANLLAHNNKSQICYCGQILLQRAAVNCSFSDNPKPFGVTFIYAGDGTTGLLKICIRKLTINISQIYIYIYIYTVKPINVE